MQFAIVDIETTGGSPKSSKITEIAIYKHDGKKIIDEFSTLINPEIAIPDFIVRLTGISNQMVTNAPKFYEVAKQIIEFTEDCVFVAHNVGFDYGILRLEFKSLGYDYRRSHLCTVRSSRHVLPGKESYSLGKLAKNLGIPINDRHRAGGDALATAHLFTILYDKDPNQLKSFVQNELNPSLLHPNLNVDAIDQLPTKTGIYKLYNEFNQLIYIGKSNNIKTRVEQHLRNSKTKKGAQMMQEICRVEFLVTGSELIALLTESALIKEHKPIYNRRLRTSRFPYGIYDLPNPEGYLCLGIAATSKQTALPIMSFTTRADANSVLSEWNDVYELCQKINNLYSSTGACFHYGIKQCKGACVGEESVESYNSRVQALIDKYTFTNSSFFVVSKGRNKSEKSIVLIDNGCVIGYGFAPYHFNNQAPLYWKRYIKSIADDRDARSIVNSFLRNKAGLYQVVSF